MQLTCNVIALHPRNIITGFCTTQLYNKCSTLAVKEGPQQMDFPPQPTCVVDCLKSKFLQQQDCILLINLTYLKCTHLPTLKYFLLMSTLVRGG